jgi:hypothetical protein
MGLKTWTLFCGHCETLVRVLGCWTPILWPITCTGWYVSEGNCWYGFWDCQYGYWGWYGYWSLEASYYFENVAFAYDLKWQDIHTYSYILVQLQPKIRQVKLKPYHRVWPAYESILNMLSQTGKSIFWCRCRNVPIFYGGFFSKILTSVEKTTYVLVVSRRTTRLQYCSRTPKTWTNITFSLPTRSLQQYPT